MAASLNDILDNHSEPVFDETAPQPPNPEQIYAATELNALIEAQITELSPRVQATFRLRKFEEFSTTEAALVLGYPRVCGQVPSSGGLAQR